MRRQDSDRHCIRSTYTHPRLTDHVWLFIYLASALFLCFIPPSQTLSASYLSTHASLTHTPLPLLLRGGTAVSEQALPLRGADRALIWKLMLRKRLIKGDRWERGRTLSWRVKASQLSGLIGRGASGQLLGRDWVTWWLSFHTVAGCTFTHSLPRVCFRLMNSTLWSAKLSRSQAKCAPANYPHSGKTQEAWCNFWKPDLKGEEGVQSHSYDTR